jgi:prevent-host-death family protein
MIKGFIALIPPPLKIFSFPLPDMHPQTRKCRFFLFQVPQPFLPWSHPSIKKELDLPGLNGYHGSTLSFLIAEVPMIVNVSEAKTSLSKLIDMAYQGEEVIIAKNNLPLVELVPHKTRAKRKLGLLKGQIRIPDDFQDEDAEINAMFYGDIP